MMFANSLALDQERRQQQHLEVLSQYDLPSLFSVPTSPHQGRPRMADTPLQFGAATCSLNPESAKGKKVRDTTEAVICSVFAGALMSYYNRCTGFLPSLQRTL